MIISIIFFVYGLAFFSMGLALLFESTRSPSLADAQVLRPLAAFGFIHGIHEWFEMFLHLPGSQLEVNYPYLDAVRLTLLVISFSSLALFSLMVMFNKSSLDIEDIARGLLVGAIILGTALIIVAQSSIQHTDYLMHLDTLVRYTLAVPSAALVAITFLQRAKTHFEAGRTRLGRWVRGVSFGFFIYSATQLIGPPLDVFPGSFINTAIFLEVFGFPVQIVRAAAAVWITLCLTQVIGIMEIDRREQFLTAQNARLEALEQLRAELLIREAMRRDLLRHTVLAQEDERTRISRELHDETSQTLTAFTFHLAVLRQIVTRSPKALEQIEYLQSLSRQMSQGIHHLVRDLRPAQLDDLGLVAALQYLVDEQEKRTGLKVRLTLAGEKRRLDPLVETVLFRVAQESLTNVARHAQIAESEINLAFAAGQVIIQIKDAGCGFEPELILTPGEGLGLAGMRERVESVDGVLKIDSHIDSGTTIEVQIPLKWHNSDDSLTLDAESPEEVLIKK